MRGAEAVKEIEEGNSALDGGQMRDGAEVHDLLRIGFREHRKAGLTTCVNVGMVAEDVQRVGRDAACGNMDDAGKQLACDFVHIRDHEQKSLRCRVGGRERTGCKGAVYGARSACLGLHLHDLDSFPEDILEARSGPRIRHFSHGAGRSNGIDGGYFRERIRYMRRGGIAVHGNLFSCHDFLSSDTFSLSYIISRLSEKVKIYRKKKREIHRFRLKNFYRKQIVPVLFKRTVLKAFSFCLSGKMGCAFVAGPAAVPD